jgi:hypothetical protein
MFVEPGFFSICGKTKITYPVEFPFRHEFSVAFQTMSLDPWPFCFACFPNRFNVILSHFLEPLSGSSSAFFQYSPAPLLTHIPRMIGTKQKPWEAK